MNKSKDKKKQTLQNKVTRLREQTKTMREKCLNPKPHEEATKKALLNF